jgi:hypothetical protein
MWQWWVFTTIHNCVSIFWFTTRKTKNPKMNFNGQPNMFFVKIIYCACDLLLKLDILNLLNILFCQMVRKMNLLPCSPFFQNFKTLKFLYDLVFHQVHLMNMYFHKNGYAFCYIKSLKSIVWFYAFLLISLKKIVV